MTTHPPAPAHPDDRATALARRLAILDAITTALSEAADLPSILDRALTTVMEITGVDGGGIFLFDPRTHDLRLTTYRGVSQPLVESFIQDPGPTIRALASNPRAAVIVRDVRTQRSMRAAMVAEHVRSYAGIPLHVHDQMLGVLTVLSRTTSDFNAADLDLLAGIGKQIGLAIERARLYDRERIFRVAQEALNNVAKHARAARAAVTLAMADGYVELTVVDDGKGFDMASQPDEHTRLGLTSMQERAALAGGACTVDSAPGKGTTVALRVPVSRGQE